MTDRAFIVTSDTGTPWRIPGPRIALSSVPLEDDRENTCGNPLCKGASDHAPDQTIRLPPPAPLPAALAIKKGGR